MLVRCAAFLLAMSPILVELFALEVHVCYTGSIRYRVRLGLAIALGSGRELLEVHDVLSQGTRLVTEHVVDHAQLLVEVGRLHLHRHVLLVIVHQPVLLHEHTLGELDHLQRDQ